MHLIHDLTNAFEKAAVASDRMPMIKYMKGHFDFYGVRSPKRKELFREILKSNGIPPQQLAIKIILDLMNHPKREMNYAAIDLALRVQKKYSQPEDLQWIREIILTRSWWDTVDGIAPNILGKFLQNYPELRDPCLKDFIQSDNIWLQRSTLLFQLRYKQDTDQDTLFTLCKSLSYSKEFFIQKAIGWALRQYAYTNKEAVYGFVEGHSLSNLSKREALKHRKN
jgi:3-methyladenine DNA glycosylase AlkD